MENGYTLRKENSVKLFYFCLSSEKVYTSKGNKFFSPFRVDLSPFSEKRSALKRKHLLPFEQMLSFKSKDLLKRDVLPKGRIFVFLLE